MDPPKTPSRGFDIEEFFRQKQRSVDVLKRRFESIIERYDRPFSGEEDNAIDLDNIDSMDEEVFTRRMSGGVYKKEEHTATKRKNILTWFNEIYEKIVADEASEEPLHSLIEFCFA
ncbi:MAG: uncharacterized protein A8A55_0926 [Amphiamblys sp. WSBS2006]|nr:MAG: uncharacterized protein A8A55_0926 [Amphiamblys sp. WSBS2006]